MQLTIVLDEGLVLVYFALHLLIRNSGVFQQKPQQMMMRWPSCLPGLPRYCVLHLTTPIQHPSFCTV